MKILLLIEHDNTVLKPVNFHTLSAARQLDQTIDALIIGHQCEAVGLMAKETLRVRRILLADAPCYAHQLAENVSALVAQITREHDYDMVLTGATTYGKNILPRVAALLDVAMVSDVTGIVSETVFTRPVYAGNALLTVKSHDRIKILTIRSTAFLPEKSAGNPEIIFEKITDVISDELSQFVDQQLTDAIRPELTDARIVVSGGRGFKSADHFKQLEGFADSIGAAVGASRAAVDAGFAPNDYQVGQTGKVVAPELYMAIGISGAIQHVAGMKDSKVIVAINSDPDAPIFDIADYGLVGDLFDILPELQNELTRKTKCD